MHADPPLIDNFRPQSVVRPNSIAELGEVVRRAAVEGAALYPFGGGTMLHLGLPPVKPGHAIDLRGLDRVIDYPARDMTITVQAGITIAKLQQILAGENQRLPIDVPQPERATLGGAIAVNASGPRRFGFGTLRDYVIGIKFIDDGGHEVKGGGRVVKNVAGYDLCKLHIGALGTLGIVTEVTLKLKPIPEREFLAAFAIPFERLADVLSRIHESKTRPACVDVMANGDTMRLVVGFEENAEAVDWQVKQIATELGQTPAELKWSALAASIAGPADGLTIRANMRPAVVPEFVAELRDQRIARWHAHAGNGIVIAHVTQDMALESARGLVSQLRRRAADGQGNVIVTRCPPAWKRELGVWGEPRGDLPLMRKVKRELDPRDLFNPGRFIV